MQPELLFHNGTIFDGRRFLPAGTGVRVRAGRITGVGLVPETGSLNPSPAPSGPA
jgi:predicted amidohydrolase YtcJ